MTELHTHTLDGCTPTPLAGYLKALGVLRLLASAANNIHGEAADATARGWWKNERFHLRTKLDRDALLRFFLEDYAPSPIISPWNRGSGFYFQESKTSEKDPATGKKKKTGNFDAETGATKKIRAISESNNPRLENLRRAIKIAKGILEDELKTQEAPEGAGKAAFMDRYRSLASEEAAAWIDAALVTSREKFDSAALLGSGGNDGNLDYSTAFHAAILEVLIEAESRASSATLVSALFDQAIASPSSGAISQFAPGGIVAANSGNGFSGETGSDPWSIILMLEGAISFAGTATTLGEVGRVRGSFPFTVSQSAGGSGAIGNDDVNTQRAYELWLPLWERPATFGELRVLLGEGRAHLGRERARDGLTFARAVAALGTSRGVREFQRLAFEARYGNMFITVPAGRFRTPERRGKNDIIADLDRGRWLTRIRGVKNAPARARTAIRQLDDALFDLTQANKPQEIPQPTSRSIATQKALIALGGIVSWLATSKEARESVLPPPRLGSQWIHDANDGSPEFRIAAALASLGLTPTSRPESSLGETGDDNDPAEASTEQDDADTPASSDKAAASKVAAGAEALSKGAPPMAAHFVSLSESSFGRKSYRWAEATSRTAVWGAGPLWQNMIAVLERRLIEQAKRGLDDKPLAGAMPARLSDVAAFLQGPPFFDDARCAALLAGLVWAQPAWLSTKDDDTVAVPFAYAALKPLFMPDRVLRSPSKYRQSLAATAKMPIPPGLIARLRRGDVGNAVADAFRRARASGLSLSFGTEAVAGSSLNSNRIAAALLISVDDYALTQLMKRAYPKIGDQGETTTNTEET